MRKLFQRPLAVTALVLGGAQSGLACGADCLYCRTETVATDYLSYLAYPSVLWSVYAMLGTAAALIWYSAFRGYVREYPSLQAN